MKRRNFLSSLTALVCKPVIFELLAAIRAEQEAAALRELYNHVLAT